MQIYEFLSKSQHLFIHFNKYIDVCLYANIRIFKQITTQANQREGKREMFVSMQIYEFLSKSQHERKRKNGGIGCLSLCKYTNF